MVEIQEIGIACSMFPNPLRREIVALLAVKAVLLTVLYFLFFSTSHRFEPDAGSLRAHLVEDRIF